MRTTHYITIAAAIGLIAISIYFGSTTPPARKAEGNTTAAPMAGGPASAMPDLSGVFDSVLAASRKQLPEHAVAEVKAAEDKLIAAGDSSRMIAPLTELAKVWQEHKQLPVAAFYRAKAAKLENSEKSLNFAGQFFQTILQDAVSDEVRMWEAQEALDCYRRALELNPKNDTLKIAMAGVYLDATNDPMQGVQLLLGIVGEQPSNVPANLMLGAMSLRSGQVDKSFGRFETVLKSEPENIEALLGLAEAYKSKGDKTKAIELLEQAKRIRQMPEFSKDIDNYINTFKNN